MKKMKSIIMTMLVMAMGVSLMSNANAQTTIYDITSGGSIDLNGDGWALNTSATANQLTSTSPSPSNSIFKLFQGINVNYTMDKTFDLSQLNDLEIHLEYEITAISPVLPEATTINIYIDGDLFGTTTATNFNSSFPINLAPVTPTLTSSSVVQIEIDYTSTLTPNASQQRIRIYGFSIVGTPWTVGVDENKNDLSNNLKVYSSDKSVYISTNENMNATVLQYIT